jgi:hypothetical protein
MSSRCARWSLIVAALAAGCGTSGSGAVPGTEAGTESGADAADAGAATDGADGGSDAEGDALADATLQDAQGGERDAEGEASSEEAAVGVPCTACVHARCTADAQSCWSDPACVTAELTAESCINQCTTFSCVTQCFAADPTHATEVQALFGCKNDHCYLPCVQMPPSTGQTCSALWSPCDPLWPGYSCCEGTCENPGGVPGETPQGQNGPSSNCCNPPGGGCDPTVDQSYGNLQCCPSPGGAPGTCQGSGDAGPADAGTCTYLTCWKPYPQSGNYCDPAVAIPCCDSRLSCNSLGALLGAECCAPANTVLPAADANLCCQHAILENPDGTVTCLNEQ